MGGCYWNARASVVHVPVAVLKVGVQSTAWAAVAGITADTGAAMPRAQTAAAMSLEIWDRGFLSLTSDTVLTGIENLPMRRVARRRDISVITG
jgi:hypothetical protein